MSLRMQTVDTSQISLGHLFLRRDNPYFIKESILSTYDFLTACSLELLFSIVFSILALFFCCLSFLCTDSESQI